MNNEPASQQGLVDASDGLFDGAVELGIVAHGNENGRDIIVLDLWKRGEYRGYAPDAKRSEPGIGYPSQWRPGGGSAPVGRQSVPSGWGNWDEEWDSARKRWVKVK